LQQQYELARIDEVKETPSVVILDAAQASVKMDKPKRKSIVILAVFLGFATGLIYSITRKSLKNLLPSNN